MPARLRALPLHYSITFMILRFTTKRKAIIFLGICIFLQKYKYKYIFKYIFNNGEFLIYTNANNFNENDEKRKIAFPLNIKMCPRGRRLMFNPNFVAECRGRL